MQRCRLVICLVFWHFSHSTRHERVVQREWAGVKLICRLVPQFLLLISELLRFKHECQLVSSASQESSVIICSVSVSQPKPSSPESGSERTTNYDKLSYSSPIFAINCVLKKLRDTFGLLTI